MAGIWLTQLRAEPELLLNPVLLLRLARTKKGAGNQLRLMHNSLPTPSGLTFYQASAVLAPGAQLATLFMPLLQPDSDA